jgi:hypothetical protein
MWEINSERRVAPRQHINLEFRVLLVATKRGVDGEEQVLPLMGSTRDISESGIALVVSARSMNVLYTLGQTYTLQLVLTLPNGSVELEVTPVRYEHINEGEKGSRILIGARIIRMRADDRVKFDEYLSSFEEP